MKAVGRKRLDRIPWSGEREAQRKKRRMKRKEGNKEGNEKDIKAKKERLK